MVGWNVTALLAFFVAIADTDPGRHAISVIFNTKISSCDFIAFPPFFLQNQPPFELL